MNLLRDDSVSMSILSEDEILSAKAKLRSFLNDCLTRYHYKKDSHGYEILGCYYEEAWEHLK